MRTLLLLQLAHLVLVSSFFSPNDILVPRKASFFTPYSPVATSALSCSQSPVSLDPCTPPSLPSSTSSVVSSILKSPSTTSTSTLTTLTTSLESLYNPTLQSRSDLYGDYKVERTWNPTSNSPRSNNAAGGKWVRSNSFTGAFFNLQGLYQNIVLDSSNATLAVNQVLLTFLSRLICVSVVLKGTCEFLTTEERNR